MASLSLLFLFFFWASFTTAAPWIVTEYYEETVTVVSDYYEEYPGTAETYTEIQTIASPTGLAPLATATITNTGDDSEYGYSSDSATIVQVLYPFQSFAAVPSSYGYEDSVYTNYVVALAFTAPTQCSASWTYTTDVSVSPPVAIKPTSMSTSLYVDNSEPFQPTTVTEVYAYVDPTQVPASRLSMLMENYSPYPSCYNPDPTGPASSSSSSSSSSSTSEPSYCGYYYCNDDSDGSWINDSYYYGISPLAIILITVLGWTFIIFIAGLFENYFHFQRLMRGWQARRGLPITWWFWIFPVSLLVCLGFSRKGFQARTVEDAEVLREKWEETGFWKKKGLWLRHGFGTGYPSVLLLGGPAPPRVGRPLSKKPVATQPLLQVSPPGSTAVSAAPSEVRATDVDQPEMSGVLPPPTSTSLQVPSRSVETGHSQEPAESTENAPPEVQPRPSSEILPESRHDSRS
jgi:hypothetical protein